MLPVLVYQLARAQTPKAIRMFVHPGCTNSGLGRIPRGTFPKAFVSARVSHGACHLFAIDRALPSRTMFAFSSLTVKLLFCPGRIRKAESPGQPGIPFR